MEAKDVKIEKVMMPRPGGDDDDDVALMIKYPIGFNREAYLRDAKAAWNYYKKEYIPSVDIKSLKETDFEIEFNKLSAKYKKLSETFGLVLSYMVFVGRYNHKSFEQYLKRVEQHPWTNQMEYFEEYGKYLEDLMLGLEKERGNRVDNRSKCMVGIKAYVKDMLDELKKDYYKNVEMARYAENKYVEEVNRMDTDITEKLKRLIGDKNISIPDINVDDLE